eukprot:529297-Rhodomonas_salina.1
MIHNEAGGVVRQQHGLDVGVRRGSILRSPYEAPGTDIHHDVARSSKLSWFLQSTVLSLLFRATFYWSRADALAANVAMLVA